MESQLTVTQEHGEDSVVEISEGTRDSHPAGTLIRTLEFYTRQSLTTQSGRAWNVRHAIEEYCRERGYVICQTNEHTVSAYYSRSTHASHAVDSLRRAITDDPRYEAALSDAMQRQSAIRAKYQPAIAQLHNLIHAVEVRADAMLKEVTDELRDTQATVLSELELPDYLGRDDLESLARPLQRFSLDPYRRYSDGVPSLEEIYALLH